MVTVNCRELLNRITEGVESRFTVEASGDFCAVRTPFLYPDNTPITVFVSEDDTGELIISDKGEASDYAFLNGIGERSISSRIRRVERRFGLEADDDELIIRTKDEELGDAITSMINAVQDVGYAVYQQRRAVKSREFRSDVERFLVQHNHRYERDVSIQGTARPRKIDYRIDGRGPRQLYLWLFDPTTQSAGKRADEISFSYIDITGPTREKSDRTPTRFAVLVNSLKDSREGESFSTAIETLNHYVPYVLSWETRHEIDYLLDAA